MTDGQLCGWRVSGDVPLPDLLPWTGDDRPTDLIIRIGDVPQISDPVSKTPLLQIAADGTCRFAVADVAAYRVDPLGHEIVVQPNMAIDAPDIRLFLFGTVFAIACLRRGLLPLHASCVRIGDKAVAFSGPSGAGKSTTAATFFKRGYSIVSDDVAVIDPNASGGALLWPALPRLKLWRDMLDGLAIPPDGLERTRAQMEKFHLPLKGFSPEPIRLSTVYHLAEARDERHEAMKPLVGVEAFLAIDRAVYRRGLGHRLLGEKAIFTRAGKVASAVSSIRLARKVSLTRAEEIVDEIVRREG